MSLFRKNRDMFYLIAARIKYIWLYFILDVWGDAECSHSDKLEDKQLLCPLN